MPKSKKNEPFVISRAPATKTMEGHLLRLAASGIQSDFDFSPHFYVRMKTGAKVDYSSPVRLLGCGARWVHFDAPDREVLFTRENVTFDGDRPFNDLTKDKWDYSVALGFSTICGNDFPVDRFMINPNLFVEQTEPRLRSPKTIVSTSKLVMSDSGGFQLGYGGLDFIHPEYLVQFYTDNADEGVVLDIPTRALVLKGKEGRDIFKATAHVHKMNGEFMYKHLPKDFRLGNVLHGITLQDSDLYRGIVEDSPVDYKFACIGGMSRFNVVEGAYRTLRSMLNGRKYDHYHLLGLASPPFIAVLSWMMAELARSGRRCLMTYDASSPITLTVNRGYYSQQTHYSQFDRINYGEIDSGRKTPAGDVANPFRSYAVQDPILNLVGGLMDYIHLYPSRTVRSFLVYANIHSLSRYTSMMNFYAADLDERTYKDLLADQYKGSKHKALLLVAIEFVTYALQHGLDKAFAKFKFYMPSFTGAIQLKPFPLMDDSEEAVTFGRAEELTQCVKQSIANFQRWHKGKWKDAPKMSKPKRIHMSTNARPI